MHKFFEVSKNASRSLLRVALKSAAPNASPDFFVKHSIILVELVLVFSISVSAGLQGLALLEALPQIEVLRHGPERDPRGVLRGVELAPHRSVVRLEPARPHEERGAMSALEYARPQQQNFC